MTVTRLGTVVLVTSLTGPHNKIKKMFKMEYPELMIKNATKGRISSFN
jgi:hypothetical protein